MTDRNALLTRLRAGIAELGLQPGAQTCERLLDYIGLLQRWNAVYNLTAVRDPQDMIARHLLDSLAIATFVHGDHLADLGTGAGLPGIPLAIVAPARRHVLVDSNGKKTRFLHEVVRALALPNVRVEQTRVERLQGEFDCVTSRAFASLADMLELGGHLLAADGRWLAMKGDVDAEEMAALPAGFRIEAVQPLRIPDLDAARHLVIVRRDGAPTPSERQA